MLWLTCECCQCSGQTSLFCDMYKVLRWFEWVLEGTLIVWPRCCMLVMQNIWRVLKKWFQYGPMLVSSWNQLQLMGQITYTVHKLMQLSVTWNALGIFCWNITFISSRRYNSYRGTILCVYFQLDSRKSVYRSSGLIPAVKLEEACAPCPDHHFCQNSQVFSYYRNLYNWTPE